MSNPRQAELGNSCIVPGEHSGELDAITESGILGDPTTESMDEEVELDIGGPLTPQGPVIVEVATRSANGSSLRKDRSASRASWPSR